MIMHVHLEKFFLSNKVEYVHVSTWMTICKMCGYDSTLAAFKYGVTFNTHGNTNIFVYQLLLTMDSLLSSRPTHGSTSFEDVCSVRASNDCQSKERQHDANVGFNN